jgi:hypothetical protein
MAAEQIRITIRVQHPLLSNGSAKKLVSTSEIEYNNNGRDVFYVVLTEIAVAVRSKTVGVES